MKKLLSMLLMAGVLITGTTMMVGCTEEKKPDAAKDKDKDKDKAKDKDKDKDKDKKAG